MMKDILSYYAGSPKATPTIYMKVMVCALGQIITCYYLLLHKVVPLCLKM